MRRQIFILNSFIFIHKIDKLYHILYTLIKKLLANDDDNGLSITDTATATLKAQSSKTKMPNNNKKRPNEDGDTRIIADIKSADVTQNAGWPILSSLAILPRVGNFRKMEFWPYVPSW